MLTVMTVLSLFVAAAPATPALEEHPDHAAVVAACLDYFEGWYEADGDRMARALSPELAKRAIAPLPNGRHILRYSPYLMMIEYTRTGATKRPVAEQNIKVEVYDIEVDIASAKVTCNEFHDYCHLAKMNGEWKIVNVLWRSPNPPAR